MVEYRPVPDADVPEFQRLLSYAFSPADGHDPIESVEDLPARATLGDRRGIYEDDELCCTGIHHWFRLRVRGAFREVPGLAAVSTPPHHRRRGFVGRLLAESLAEYRERGAGVCVLWPFNHPFYRRYGWARCSRYGRVTCAPDALAGIDTASDEPNGRFVSCSADDWEALDRVYRATNSQGLAMDRTEAWWRKRVLTGWDGDPYPTGVERNGRLVGYLVYDIEKGTDDTGKTDDGRRMVVRELGYIDSSAYRAVLEFCRYHDSQASEIEFYGPVDARLQDLVRDPRDVEIEIEPGAMARMVDVSRALSALSYPADIEADLTIAVADDTAGWNDGRFRLSIADGTGTCEPTDDGPEGGSGADVDVGTSADSGSGSVDLTTSIATLSQVAVGYLSVERAERVGDFEVASTDARNTLAAAFPPEEPFLREGF
jgi:predicted acetyltransferase